MARIDIKVSPYAYKLAGHPFEAGDNPKVNAQFSIRYCVANALLRRSSKLQHFNEENVMDNQVIELIKNIHVFADPSPGDPAIRDGSASSHLSVRMELETKDGNIYHKDVDLPRGNPGNPLIEEEHLERFRDCVAYAEKRRPEPDIERILDLIGRLEMIEDVRTLIPLLT